MVSGVHAGDFELVKKIKPGETLDSIVAKAAHVVPTPRQIDYLEQEYIAFVHFGPNTFTGREWGSGMEDPAVFAPTGLDTDQWCETFKAAGMRQVVMTFKHHDGYVLWPSRYEKHQTIRNSPFQNGRADIARELSKSCAKYGLRFGIYLSPADLYQIESPKGLYGNGSKPVKSAIPTDPESFLSEPAKPRTDRPQDAPVFTYECDDYNRYMLNQLYEMLTEYGPVHEVWFDGAHPKRKGGQTYAYAAWYELIRTLAPQAVIFGKGPDVRWCGNEAGRTRETEWNVIPLETAPAENDWPDRTAADLGSRAKLKEARYLYYVPCETNTSIRHGWFWRDDTTQSVRTADDVFDIYERAVGGNSVFMLNVPPNRDGRLSPRDVKSLVEAGRRIRETYGSDLARYASISVDGEPRVSSPNILWQPEGTSGELVVTLPVQELVNRFVIQEATATSGQRIEKHAFDAWIDGAWKEVATGTTVGFKKILRFPTVQTDKLRLRILESRLEPTVARISVHFYDQPPLPVTARQSLTGEVELSLKEPAFDGKGAGFQTRGLDIRYTTDGTEPTHGSPLYQKPIDMAKGGVVKACSIASTKRPGNFLTFRFGPAKAGWKAEASGSENAEYGPDKAIDGDPATMWHSRWSAPAPGHPHTFHVDLGQESTLTAITYLPRQDRAVPDGMIETGRVETSLDGGTWHDAGSFVFGNLVNDPVERTHEFPQPVRARHVRLVSTAGAAGKPYAAIAEFGVLTAEE
ncbi:MAG: alpha-L-fucosidase [Akkermansiaceae bacterium]|nr:alpha-L-fucosidase [Akkermansiaceae bacterium]